MIDTADIRDVLKNLEPLANLAESVGEDEDLFEKGLDSFGSVQLMLALEERFDIEFPDNLLNRRSFSTLAIIRDTVATLTRSEAA